MFNTILSRKVNRQKLFKAKLRYKSNQKKIGTSFESIKKHINYTNSMKKVFGIFAITRILILFYFLYYENIINKHNNYFTIILKYYFLFIYNIMDSYNNDTFLSNIKDSINYVIENRDKFILLLFIYRLTHILTGLDWTGHCADFTLHI